MWIRTGEGWHDEPIVCSYCHATIERSAYFTNTNPANDKKIIACVVCFSRKVPMYDRKETETRRTALHPAELSLRVEQGTEPFTVTVTVYDSQGRILETFENKRLENAPWHIRMLWKIEDKIQAKMHENLQNRVRRMKG